jgi:hypothetical protein
MLTGPPPEFHGTRDNLFHGSFGQIVAALIGGVSLIAVALISFTVGQGSESAYPSPIAVSTTTVTATVTTSPEVLPQPSDDSAPPPASIGVRFEQNLKLVKGESFDLDSTALDWGQSITKEKSRFFLVMTSTKVSGDPDPAECVDPTNVTVGDGVQADNILGASFCFLTDEGRTAWVTVVDRAGGGLAIDITVWREPIASPEN